MNHMIVYTYLLLNESTMVMFDLNNLINKTLVTLIVKTRSVSYISIYNYTTE